MCIYTYVLNNVSPPMNLELTPSNCPITGTMFKWSCLHYYSYSYDHLILSLAVVHPIPTTICTY